MLLRWDVNPAEGAEYTTALLSYRTIVFADLPQVQAVMESF